MKKLLALAVLLPLLLFTIGLPFYVSAQDVSGSGTGADVSGSGTGATGSGNTGIESPQDISLKFNLQNPLGGNGPTNLQGFVAKILDVLVIIAIPIVTFFIIYSGLLFVLAAGNAEKLSKAKMTLMYTLIGAALLLGAKVLATAIEKTLTDITTASIITNLFG